MGKTRQTGDIVSDGLVSVDIDNDQFKVGTGVTIYGSSGIISATSLYVGGTQVSGGGSSDVVDDTTPQLGGNLDLNSKDITGIGSFNVTGVITATSFSGSGANLTDVAKLSGQQLYSSGDLRFADDGGIYFGTGYDMYMLHLSTDGNLIRSLNQDLIIDTATSGDIILKPIGNVGIGTDDPTAKLDVRGTTETQQLNVTGVSTFQGNVHLGDNDTIYLGDGNDLRVYHSGGQSYIQDTGTGNLNLLGDASVVIGNQLNTETLAKFNVDGSAELYYDNSKKFETTGIGVSIVGVGNTATITGPSELVLDPGTVGDNTGKVVILGNLQVDGTTTEINSTTLTVDDKSIVLASGAADSAAANGAGIEIDGASATFQYAHTGTKWVANKSIEATSFIKNGGASTEFLKADGSVDTSTYITSADGGNAATLDSIDSTSFLRSDQLDNVTSGGIIFNDNIYLNLGTGQNNDSFLFYDGTNANFHVASGDLIIATKGGEWSGDDIIIESADDFEVRLNAGTNIGSGTTAIYATGGGSVKFNHNGSTKFETISTGATVTGDLYATTLYGDGSQLTGISAGGSVAGSDGQIQYNNGGSFGGAAQLYYDDVNNRLGLNASSPAYTFDLGESASTIRLVSESGGTAIRIGDGNQNDITLLRVDGAIANHDGESNSAAYGYSFRYLGSGGGNNNKLQIVSDNQEGTAVQAFTMLQDGKIGIANTAPSTELDVGGTITATNYTGKIYVDESANDNAEHNLVFIDAAWSSGNQGNAHLDLEIDSGEITFNPSTNTLTVPNIAGNLAGIATGATRVYIDESEDDDANYHVMFSDVTPGGGNEYRTLQVDTGGIQFNPSGNHLKINGASGAVLIGTNRSTNIDASVEIDHGELSGTAYTNSMVTDHNGNIRITAGEPTIELIGSDGGSHAASIYIRNLNEGYAFINNPTTEELELKSFTASASGFHATGNGGNVSSINKLLRIGKDGNIGVGDIDAAFKLDIDGGVRVSSGSSITFAGPTTTGALYLSNNSDTTLLRVTSDGSTANLSGDYGFSLKYLGSGSGNNNSLQILSDNQNAGTQVKAFTMLQDGKIGIANTAPTSTLDVNGTLNVSGVSTFQNNVHLLDDDKLLFGGSVGTHDGLEIYHDGNHSYIDDSGTGNLYLRSGTLAIQNLAGSKTSALFQSGGGQEFYHNNTKRLETISTGATVTGDLYATTLYGDGSNLTGISTYSDGSVDSHLNTSSASANEVLSWTGSDYDWVAQSSGGSSNPGIGITAIARVVDQKSSGTDGGSVPSTNWFTRTLNTIKYDPYGIVTVSSNQFTLQPGQYKITFSAPATRVDQHICRLYNVTAGSVTAYGQQAYTNDAAYYSQTSSLGTAYIDISSATTYRIDHRCKVAQTATDALGVGDAALGVSQSYTDVLIEKFTAVADVSYSNSDVDTYLNTSSASANDVLSWDGSNYAWVAQSGGGGGGVGYFTTTTSGVNYTGIGTISAVGIGTKIEIVPYDDQDGGTLSFEGSAGNLFSVTNNLSSGSIFAVNDISGSPSIDVNADGTVLVAPHSTTEKVGVGTVTPGYKLDVVGDLNFTGTLYQNGSVFNPGVTPSGGEGAVQFNSSSNLSGISTLLSVGSTTFSVGIGTIISIKPYDDQDGGTLSFEGSAGNLLSITNNLSSGSIFAVNDISGAPSIDVNADGTVSLNGTVEINGAAPVTTGKSIAMAMIFG